MATYDHGSLFVTEVSADHNTVIVPRRLFPLDTGISLSPGIHYFLLQLYDKEGDLVHEYYETASVLCADEKVYTIEIQTDIKTGERTYIYTDALSGMTPEEVGNLPFFIRYGRVCRLSQDGTVEYYLDRKSLATDIPLKDTGEHAPNANKLKDNGKYGSIMMEYPLFYYKFHGSGYIQIDQLYPVKIKSGKNHVALIMNDGSLWTTGDNSYGQLCRNGGRDTLKRVGDDLINIDYNEYEVVDVSCGYNHTVFIVENRNDKTRKVYSAGSNSYGQLCRAGSGVREITIPTVKQDGTPYDNTGVNRIQNDNCLSVECGAYHTHFLFAVGEKSDQYTQDGNITYRRVLINSGRNAYGELCRGYTGGDAGVVELPGMPISISSRAYHSIIITADETALENKVIDYGISYSCGTNYYSNLCRTSIDKYDVNVLPITFGTIKNAYTGWGSTALIDSNDNLYTCGDNEFFQLGRQGESGSNSELNITSNSVIVKSLSMGENYIAYIDQNDSLWTSGLADYGVLLVDNKNGYNLKDTGYKAQIIGTGFYFTGFVSNNIYHCAGNNTYKQLGREQKESSVDIDGTVHTNNGITTIYKPESNEKQITRISLSENQVDNTWDTFHSYNGRLVNNLYISLFPAKVHNIPKPTAFSHDLWDDITTPIDERYTQQYPADAIISSKNNGKKYQVLSYEQVTMIRILSLFLFQNENIDYFFGDNEVNDILVSPIFVDGIKLDKLDEKTVLSLQNINTQEYENIAEYNEDRVKYTCEYYNDNTHKLLPRTLIDNQTESSIDFSDTATTMKMSINGHYDLSKTDEEIPYYFMTYGGSLGNMIKVDGRYNTEPIIVQISDNGNV